MIPFYVFPVAILVFGFSASILVEHHGYRWLSIAIYYLCAFSAIFLCIGRWTA